MKAIPSAAQASANSGDSDRNPYPGWIASVPVSTATRMMSSTAEVGGDRPQSLADAVGLVGLGAMEGEPVLVGEDGDRRLAHLVGRAQDTDRDLAAIRDQDSRKLAHWPLARCPVEPRVTIHPRAASVRDLKPRNGRRHGTPGQSGTATQIGSVEDDLREVEGHHPVRLVHDLADSQVGAHAAQHVRVHRREPVEGFRAGRSSRSRPHARPRRDRGRSRSSRGSPSRRSAATPAPASRNAGRRGSPP